MFVDKVRCRPYELRHQWKETVKWASLFVVVVAVVTNCVFYFTFQILRTDDASLALQKLESPSRYTLAAVGSGSVSETNSAAGNGDGTVSTSPNAIAGGLSWVVFLMCCGLFVVLVLSYMRSLLATYPWVARDVSTRSLKDLELASLRGKPAQLAIVSNPLLQSIGSEADRTAGHGGGLNPGGTFSSDAKSTPSGRGAGALPPASDSFKALGQYRPGLGARQGNSDASNRPGRQQRVERIGAAPDRTRSATAGNVAITVLGRR